MIRNNDIARFLEKVSVNPVSGCIEWTAGMVGGYGKFTLKGRCVLAHRWYFEYCKGGIPSGLQLDHLCRNRRCVNPDHLEPVTCKENLMRGDTFQARNAAKTHCPQGHEYSEENTRVDPKGSRRCRECSRIEQRRPDVLKRKRFRRRASKEAQVATS